MLAKENGYKMYGRAPNMNILISCEYVILLGKMDFKDMLKT